MNQSFVTNDPARFAAAVRRFDEENAQDPNHELHNGEPVPRELLYADWLTQWVLRLEPNAPETLRLAARCAHLRRWVIVRSSYPATRAGYLCWRGDLKKYHADAAGKILREVGYADEAIDTVQKLISKEAFPKASESRTLEDALCLVFLEHQFADLAAKSTPEKMINALRKTWQKMTPAAHAMALKLQFNPNEAQLLHQALHPAPSPQKQ